MFTVCVFQHVTQLCCTLFLLPFWLTFTPLVMPACALSLSLSSYAPNQNRT